jgi:AcrR family transcriptional regulator
MKYPTTKIGAPDVNDVSRPYRSTLRADQARATRRRIVHAAHDLFLEQGYARTTIDSIADRAEVSRKTVFTSVGSKATALKLAWDWALAGDDEPIAMADRPDVQRIRQLHQPAATLTAWARLQGEIACRLARLYEVVVVASDSDPEAAELRAVNERNRIDGARWFAEHLESIGALRTELDVDRATSIAAVLMDPVPAGRLVHDAGWSVDEYLDYLTRTASAALLNAGGPARRR